MSEINMANETSDLIYRQAALDALGEEPEVWCDDEKFELGAHLQWRHDMESIMALPSAQPEIIRCKDCKHWKQQTNYQGVPLSFGFCESEEMWRSLSGETYEVSHIDTDDDFYCGYAIKVKKETQDES